MGCKVIAEIGWNHMGDMGLAEEMICEAANAGADYAKFQTWSVDALKAGPWNSDGRLEIYRKAELTRAQHERLADFCEQKSIKFLTSLFNIRDVEWLADILSGIVKIPSHEVYNLDLIKKASGYFDQMLISTGASSWSEIMHLPDMIPSSQVTLMHCVSSYPCLDDNVNLPRIRDLRTISNSIGYSGHGIGIFDALAAAEYNLDFIEKHFTLDRNLPGRDNQFAILPEELKTLCQYLKVRERMNVHRGRDFQECERDVVVTYRGRWSKV